LAVLRVQNEKNTQIIEKQTTGFNTKPVVHFLRSQRKIFILKFPAIEGGGSGRNPLQRVIGELAAAAPSADHPFFRAYHLLLGQLGCVLAVGAARRILLP
jgi:hypothetical protein